MELIYSMRRKPLKYEPPHFERASGPEVVRPICTISTSNTIAFSSPTELTDTDCDTWGGHVYVCDLDTPWDSHKVVSTTYAVSALEWDNEGKQLLVATTEGEVTVFGQKDFLLNEWVPLYTSTFSGERIIKAIFFHNGRRLVAVEKKPDAPITEKIQALRSTPTLKGFGGVACPGAVCVSGSGLVGALCPGETRAADSLRAGRDHVTCAALHHKNGKLLIAAVCVSASGRACVRCAIVLVSRAPSAVAPSLSLTPLPALICSSVPSSISWCLREDSDALLVAGGGSLALWKLQERQHQPHKMLAKGPVQGSTTPGGGPKTNTDCFNTVCWQQAAAWVVEGSGSGGGGGRHVSASKLPLAAPHIVLAAPRRLHLLARDSHVPICSRAVITSGPEPAAVSPPKKSKYSAERNGTISNVSSYAIVSCVDISCLGGVCVAVDTHAQLHVYKLPQPWADIPSPLSVQQASSLLEYALVSGCDSLDVLLTLKHNVVEAVYERLTESFQRQPATFQQYYFHTWLKMRISLCRLIPTASSSVSWLTCLATLWGLWAACQAALRPDDRPDDRLAALLDDHHVDHDKVLIALESKAEFPSETQVLIALRRPLQRAVDIAVTALAAAANLGVSQGHHGYELWADPIGISLLRKLVVLARGAGLGDASISRLLSRLHQPAKPELIEECGALSAQWAARVWEALPRAAVSAPHGHSAPLYLEYGVEPESLRVSPAPPAAAHTDATPAAHMDSIRYMYLGGGARWRQCVRCGARALPHAQPARQPAQRAHDARFLPACRCGGKWTLVSIV